MVRESLVVGTAHYIVERDHAFGNQMYVAHSHALICPKCHGRWAELSLDDEDLSWPRAQFCATCIPPSDCGEWFPVPGSILVEEGWGVIDDSLLQSLPPDLLIREFNLHLKAYNL